MSSNPIHSMNLDEEFVSACLAISREVGNQPPISPTDTLLPPTAFTFGKLASSNYIERMASDDVVSESTKLTDRYPNAYTDFYGCGTPCIFKSGPDWHVPKGPHAQLVEREARPVYQHDIGHTWLSIGKSIYYNLDSLGVKWTSINPIAYADAGEATPFCSLIISIGVIPHSLHYDAAVAAATVVKQILTKAGFPAIEVAFVESVFNRSVAAGPKLLSFEPRLDQVPDLRKPFTPTLGLSIAPFKYPYLEGTGGLYFRLSKDDNRTAILTCAHVARPSNVYRNTGMTYKSSSQPREEIVALGNMGYNNAIKSMMSTIGFLLDSIDACNKVLVWLGKPTKGESSQVTERRKENLELVEKMTKKIEEVHSLHDEVTKYHTTTDQRVIGFVLHSEKIEVAVEPHGFTQDWALIELYDQKIDWSSFPGNKVYIGGNLQAGNFGAIMFPQADDRTNYTYPDGGLLQAYGVVQDQEIRDPQHLDALGKKCLLVIKNGLGTGTTVGRCNGLESFNRVYEEEGIDQTSVEIAVLPYHKPHGTFSAGGDSGSVVLARDGRIVGLLTGGSGGLTRETDFTYLTPYWWIEQQVKAKYPGAFLYDVIP